MDSMPKQRDCYALEIKITFIDHNKHKTKYLSNCNGALLPREKTT